MNDDHLHLGVSWYPEMWPESEWKTDALKMKEVGFSLVRLFEFAWKCFEPQEGVFEFDWALRVLDHLHAQGIQVMLGTPSAAPPAWLTSKYSDVLLTKADGSIAQHGKRKHYNPNSKTYRKLCQRIVSKMVENLGNHPAIHSWQIDNEMSGFDYGQETEKQFQGWLENRYKTIENLNQTWGLNFWSQAYDSFSQVKLCTAEVGSVEAPERHHPSLIMAIAHFQNEGWTSFIEEQCKVIRNVCTQPITTNMTGFIGQMDWFAHFKGLDRAGVSSYADLSYFHYNLIKLDRLRAEKPAPYWLLETAPNWSGGGPVWNIHHDERGIRLFTWASILLGGSMVLYWQWRSHWAGQEMQHGTCLSQTGQWMPGKDTWSALSKEFKSMEKFLISHPAPQGPLGIVADCQNSWVFSIDPIDPANRYESQLRESYYKPLLDAHYHRSILHPDADLSPYRVLICPHLPLLSESFKARLKLWVETGGQLLLGPMVGTRTEEMTAWKTEDFGGLESLIGARSDGRFSPHWVEDTITIEFSNGMTTHPRFWCESFRPENEDTTILARYKGGYGNGKAAVVSRKLGEGEVITLGCPVDQSTYLHLVSSLAEQAGIVPLLKSGPGIVATPRVDREGKLVALALLNTTKEKQTAQLQWKGSDFHSNDLLPNELILDPLEVKFLRCPESPIL